MLSSTFGDYRKETLTCCMPGFSTKKIQGDSERLDSTLRCTSKGFEVASFCFDGKSRLWMTSQCFFGPSF